MLIKECIKEQFDSLVREHEGVDQVTFNEDDTKYKLLMAEAIDGKAYALLKMEVFLDSVAAGLDELSVERILHAPIRSFASPAAVLELRTGLIDFPWKAVVEERSASIVLGGWNAAGVAKQSLEFVVSSLNKNTNLRSIAVNDEKLDLPDGWASTKLQWESSKVVKAMPATVAVLLQNCSCLTSLNLRSCIFYMYHLMFYKHYY